MLQFGLAELAEWAEQDGERARQLGLLANHKSVGMTVLVLALLRLVWRLVVPPPSSPETMPTWQLRASLLAHWLLYFFLFALPVTGWLLSSAKAFSVSWFGLFAWPDLVAASEPLAERMEQLHELGGKALFVLALIHVLAALKHALIDRDGVLSRMTSPAPLGLAGLLIVLGSLLLVPPAREVVTDVRANDESPATVEQAAVPARSASEDAITSELPRWDVDYDASFIEFTGEQAGAAFTGRFTDWEATIAFDPDQLEDSAARVQLNMSAVSSGDAERDETISGPEFFAASRFPVAVYEASEFERLDDSLVAAGTLTIKGVSLPVELRFRVEGNELSGEAVIDRLLFQVGTGDWESTDWVGRDVDVAVYVVRK